MHLLMLLLMLTTLLTMAALLAWIRPAVAARWQQARAVSRAGLVGLWLAGTGFLLFFPHDDSFTGLDNMTYRHLSHAFLEGRGFHDPDTVLAGVPSDLRENFLLHRGPVGRPTRDRVFQLSGWQSVDAKPFFMPVLPLAAAGLDPLLAPERFVPIMGALWLALMLMAGFCAGGGWGILAVAALVLGTAWPAWFLRGFYAEGVGAILVAGVVAASAARPLRGGIFAVAGFAMGLAVSYHPTLVVLSVPVSLGLILERRAWKAAFGLATGLLAGLFPFWALTRWVCQPYGDWTRLQNLQQMIFIVPEHRAIALVLGILILTSVVALWAGFHPSVRIWIRRMDERATPWAWLAACVLPLLLIVVLQGASGTALREGAVSVWSGIRWPYGLWLMAGAGLVLMKRRPVREHFWLAAFCWVALFFIFIKGVEIPAGLWSQRRFLPVALMVIALLTAPLSAWLAALSGRGWRTVAIVLAVLAGGANLVRWPSAFAITNEKGAAEWISSVADQMGTGRLVVFDYYQHSVPYAAGLKQHVLGLNETSRDHWPEVAKWIGSIAKTGQVWVATSWTPCTLEEGFRLESVFSKTGSFPIVRAKAFFPAEPDVRVMENHFMQVVPLVPGKTGAQNKVLDGSPIGLRGPWGKIRQGATWSRQGSGVVGPVPGKGGQVDFIVDCSWAPPFAEWTRQVLLVTPPWGGAALRLEVPAGDHVVQGTVARPADDGERNATGVYSVSVERPYNPAEYGLRGYAPDLGVTIRRISIR